ncbi:MAG: cupin domain-containing protein [Acidobacteria bacterium]|nr:cupin domain-containing protein [Acidobacteriota bacterium]
MLHSWNSIPWEQMNPDIERQVIHTGQMTLSHLRIKAGGVVPRHHHPNEQCTLMVSGRLRFVFDDRTVECGPGEVVEIPPHAPHRVEALEDTEVFDLFTPPREDWKSGNDAYLRQK